MKKVIFVIMPNVFTYFFKYFRQVTLLKEEAFH